MATADRARIRELFGEAVELAPDERRRFLDDACGTDAPLRAQVDSLLGAFERAGEYLGSPSLGSPAPGAPTVSAWTRPGEQAGAVVGRYKLLEQLGEGGFGVVFLAEQREPVVRKVALKIIKLGMDTRQVIARFEAERQALAMMDHPNIAKVLDAGETETGRPYFVMELVKGEPITRFCDEERLSVAERLALFIDACQAVQHAHQKGIIHRDLKPSNVLVSRFDDRAVVKIIDFGIAKAAAGERLTDQSLFTGFQQLLGTPAYMSPEQAGLSDLDIDTRSDIYALGVLLYELLAGTTPFDAERLRSAGFDEMRRIIRDEEPPRPSTRIGTLRSAPGAPAPDSGVLDDQAAARGGGPPSAIDITRRRRADPRSLERALQGDLDWIAMKALEKDRTRRYDSANSLAADVERHLAGEPVLAAPPSAAYRARKFVRRHKVGAIAGSLVAAALLLGIAGASLGLAWALHERSRAAGEASRSEQSAEVAQAVNDFLNRDVLRAILPAGERVAARGRDVKLREVLDEAARRLDAASAPGGPLADKPAVEAAIRLTLGDAFVSLGEPDVAAPHVRRGHELTEGVYGAADARTMAAELSVALVCMDQGRLEESATLLRELLGACERVYGSDAELASEIRRGLALVCWRLGLLAEAAALSGRVVEYYTRAKGAEHPSTLGAINCLAEVYRAQRRLAEAETLFRRIIEITERQQGRTHPNSLRYNGNLAAVLFDQARYDEAVAILRDNVERFREVHGPTHPDTAQAMGNLATVLSRKGDPAGAEAVHREALNIFRTTLGAEHPRTLRAAGDLAPDLLDLGRPDEAEALLTPTLESLRRTLGTGHEATQLAMTNLAIAYDDLGRLEDAERLTVEAIDAIRSAFGAEHVQVLGGQTNLASIYARTGRMEKARALLVETLAAKRRVLGLRHPFTRNCMNLLASVLDKMDGAEEARALREELAAWEVGEGRTR